MGEEPVGFESIYLHIVSEPLELLIDVIKSACHEGEGANCITGIVELVIARLEREID